jgi:PAS domain S-box-containing protein
VEKKSYNFKITPSAALWLFLIFIAGAFTLHIVVSLPGTKPQFTHLYHVIETLTIPLVGVIFLWQFFARPEQSAIDFDLNKQEEVQDDLEGRLPGCSDATDQDHVIHALEDCESHYRQLFEQTDYALLLFDGNLQKTLDVNPTAEMIFRLNREELIKKKPNFFFAPGEYEKILQQKATGGNDTFHIIDMLLLAEEQRELHLSVNVKRVELSGQPAYLCVISDVTENTHMEEQANIIQARLIQANKMTSLGVLVTGIAHEINNPNNYILASAEILTRAWKDIRIILSEYDKKHQDFKLGGIPYKTMQHEIQELLDNITTGSQRIRDVVNTLKDFSRSGSGAIRNDIDMNQIVTRVTTIVSHQINRHTNRFNLETAQDLPLVTGNYQQLEQVITNLIMNAIQAISSPDQSISLTTRYDTLSDTVCIEVSDEGTGIASEIADKVMEPFFTTRLDSGGSGLGLTISMAIIKAHNGMLTFSSSPGNGTKFLVQLPVTKLFN